jgi:RecA-family ATPase
MILRWQRSQKRKDGNDVETKEQENQIYKERNIEMLEKMRQRIVEEKEPKMEIGHQEKRPKTFC